MGEKKSDEKNIKMRGMFSQPVHDVIVIPWVVRLCVEIIHEL